MKSMTQEIVRFAIETSFDDLPQSVVHEAKRLLLDSIGCALGGINTEKGGISIKLANRLGGTPESTVIGTGDKVLSTSAAFANGELINAMDYDAINGHTAPSVIPAPLALAEGVGASGMDLILSIVLGYEISARLSTILPHFREIIEQGPEKGKYYMPPVTGFSYCVFGGAAAAGRILGLDRQKMGFALGIAGYSAPVLENVKCANTTPMAMTKYLSSGWISVAEVTAALLAQLGYTGDDTILDGEHGFWRFLGGEKWDPELAFEGIGRDWHLLKVAYKRYPSCGMFQYALDYFAKIINDNNLTYQNIDTVRVFLRPEVDMPQFNAELSTHIDAQFSVPYAVAALALGIKAGPEWQDADMVTNPEIHKFMEKVICKTHPAFSNDYLKNSARKLASIEVESNGSVFTSDSESDETRAKFEARKDDAELIEKFRVNASRLLAGDKIDEAIETIMHLEKVDNISRLLKVVCN